MSWKKRAPKAADLCDWKLDTAGHGQQLAKAERLSKVSLHYSANHRGSTISIGRSAQMIYVWKLSKV